jgi:D-sedoheptulose 7-phosphate isomerase
MGNVIIDQLKEAAGVLETFINDQAAIDCIEQAAQVMADCIKSGGKIMTCGNGGSLCDAMHFAEELTGKFRAERIPLPAMSLADPAHITCVANDFGFEHIFSRYVDGLGKPGDVLLGISTSGNSSNVLNAAIAAQKKNMKIVALTGKNGGKLADLADIEIRVPHQGYSDRIQEIHIKIIHIIIFLIEQKVKG